MKKSLPIILVAVMCSLMTSISAYAQENGNRNAEGKVVRGPYATNRFGDNWFVGVGGGASIYIGGFNRDFGARIRPTVDVNFGKWFTPSIGARVDFNLAPMYREKIQGQWHKFTYWGLHADFLWNVSNALGGYKETRVYQVIPYIGAGYAQNSGEDICRVSRSFVLDAGVINKFRVSNRIDLNLEIAATAGRQSLDQVAQCKNSSIDVPLSVVAGITFKLGKTNFQRVSSITEPLRISNESLQKEYDQFKEELAASKALNDKYQAENAELKAAIAAMGAETVVTKDRQTTFLTLYFTIGKSVLSEEDLANLEVYMDGVDKLTKGGEKKYHIYGAADKATGNKEINQRLSKERAEYVKNILINKYNVKESNIAITVVGDENNRFDTPSLNRTATIFVTVE